MTMLLASPPGVVSAFGGTAIPPGWLECNGQAINRTTYSNLFSTIGTVFGIGDGSTTFNVPDFRGCVPLGVGLGTGLTNRLLAQTGGEETHLLSSAEMPAHNHDLSNHTHDMTHTHNFATFTGSSGGPTGINQPTSITASPPTNTTGPSTNTSGTPSNNNSTSAGSGGTHNNMQPYLVLRILIKT